MKKRLHIGLTVVPTRSDFFFFLRNWTDAHTDENTFFQLSLPEHLLKTVKNVEYSWRWMFRPLYYRHVAAYLRNELGRTVREATAMGQDVILYLPDDGYWAELLVDIRAKLGARMTIVYVQHGMARLVRASAASEALRRAFNRLSRLLFGGPMFGYGFGSAAIDAYIVCLPAEAAYVTENFGTPAHVAPWFVWGKHFERAATWDAQAVHPRRLLFATSPLFSRRLDIFGNASRHQRQYFADITTCLRAIKMEAGCEILVRFHPNEDRQQAKALFHSNGLDEIAEIDENFDLMNSLRVCSFVMSYASTVLLESVLIGRVPIHFIPEAYPPQAMPFANEPLRLRHSHNETQIVATDHNNLRQLFSERTIEKYAKAASPMDYSIQLPWLQT
mgnify:CR=1 FL=1|jgi:hypothetical protein